MALGLRGEARTQQQGLGVHLWCVGRVRAMRGSMCVCKACVHVRLVTANLSGLSNRTVGHFYT